MDVQIHSSIDEIPAQQWNALVRDNHPFLRHEFLSAMERHACVGKHFGWVPCHVGLYRQGSLVGAMPLYEKHNGYGEFVFDHAWADAYQRSGLAYYPKLVSAVPYTPATGQRMLAAAGQEHEIFPLLLNTAQQLAKQTAASGFHCLFPEEQGQQFLAQQGLLVRADCQFHWHNDSYQNFDEFLARLTSRKRKKIRQERRKVQQAEVSIRVLSGHDATPTDWQNCSRFYHQTFKDKWGMATFNYEFFMDIAENMPDQVVLILADVDGECIAAALLYRSDTTLYGRHWGCDRHIDCLHFEACYYQGIEYCIQHGLSRFEPGAQGEHKLARGFMPTLTQSSHWLTEPYFLESIEQFVLHERKSIVDYIQQLELETPYRQELSE